MPSLYAILKILSTLKLSNTEPILLKINNFSNYTLEDRLMKAYIVQGILPEDRSFMFFKISNPYYQFAWHYHTHYELFLPIRGTGNCIVGDYAGNFSAGDMILVGDNLPHVFYTAEDFSLDEDANQAYILRFSKDIENVFTDKFPECSQVSRLFEKGGKGIRYSRNTANLVREKMEMLMEREPNCDFKSFMIFLEILGIISSAKKTEMLSMPAFKPKIKEQNIARIDKICGYINRNYLSKIELKSLAAHSGTSVSNLCSFFRRSTNKSVIDYVNEMRISHACRLILDTEKSISEIAFLSGFNTLSNFNRKFLKFRKIAPGKYRSMFKNTELMIR